MEKERLPVRRHRTAYVCLLASLLLHLTALYLGNYLWRDELDAETFRVRLARIPPQFKPPRPIPLPRLDVEALKVEMEYLRADQPARSRPRPQSRKRGGSTRDRDTNGPLGVARDGRRCEGRCADLGARRDDSALVVGLGR